MSLEFTEQALAVGKFLMDKPIMLYGQRMFREVDTGSPTRRCATQGLVERVPFPRN
jgi:hypothetical protein